MPLSLKTMEVQIEGDKWKKGFRTVQLYWESGGKKEREKKNEDKHVPSRYAKDVKYRVKGSKTCTFYFIV